MKEDVQGIAIVIIDDGFDDVSHYEIKLLIIFFAEGETNFLFLRNGY